MKNVVRFSFSLTLVLIWGALNVAFFRFNDFIFDSVLDSIIEIMISVFHVVALWLSIALFYFEVKRNL